MTFQVTDRKKAAASVLFSIVVGLAVWMRLDGERRRATAGVQLTDVLISRRYLPAGKAVTADLVERRAIPAAYAEPGAFREAKELGSAPDGARARIALSKGEQLTRSKVEVAGAEPGLAWIVSAGQRAIGLRLPPERAAGGHVQPGDRVDVLSVARRGDARAQTLARRVRVLAVGEKLWDAAAVSSAAPAASGAAESVLVAVMLSPDDAARVAAAAENGTVVLALASPLGDRPSGAEEPQP